MEKFSSVVPFPVRHDGADAKPDTGIDSNRIAFIDDAARIIVDAALEESGAMYGMWHMPAEDSSFEVCVRALWERLESAIHEAKNTYGLSADEMKAAEEKAKDIFLEKAGPTLAAGGVWHVPQDNDDMSQWKEAV